MQGVQWNSHTLWKTAVRKLNHLYVVLMIFTVSLCYWPSNKNKQPLEGNKTPNSFAFHTFLPSSVVQGWVYSVRLHSVVPLIRVQSSPAGWLCSHTLHVKIHRFSRYFICVWVTLKQSRTQAQLCVWPLGSSTWICLKQNPCSLITAAILINNVISQHFQPVLCVCSRMKFIQKF